MNDKRGLIGGEGSYWSGRTRGHARDFGVHALTVACLHSRAELGCDQGVLCLLYSSAQTSW